MFIDCLFCVVRKLQPTWTEQVKVNIDNGLEGPTDDGYSWRKYGQKDILGAKYPRLVSSLLHLWNAQKMLLGSIH